MHRSHKQMIVLETNNRLLHNDVRDSVSASLSLNAAETFEESGARTARIKKTPRKPYK